MATEISDEIHDALQRGGMEPFDLAPARVKGVRALAEGALETVAAVGEALAGGCPTCKTRHGRCCECGEGVGEADLAPDPHAQEVDGDERPHLLCDECTHAKLDDI